MIKEENGFSTPFAIFIILSLSILTATFSMLVFANQKRINSFEKLYENKVKAYEVLKSFENDLQQLAKEEYDSGASLFIRNLIYKYSNYNIEFKDISTGINPSILNKKFLDSLPIKNLLEVKEQDVITEFGCVNTEYAREDLLDAKNKKDLTSLVVNNLPFYNLYYMQEDFITSILQFCKVTEIEKKTELLLHEKYNEDLTVSDISKIIGVNTTHAVMNFIGTKTNFWKVNIKVGRINIEAVFGGIPSEKDDRKIGKYILIKKDFKIEGRNNDERAI